jgi:hypothetical protein
MVDVTGFKISLAPQMLRPKELAIRAQVEATVVEAVRQSLRKNAPTEGHSDLSDRDAIDRFVERIVISPKSIEIHLREARAVEATETNRSSAAQHARDSDEDTAIA